MSKKMTTTEFSREFKKIKEMGFVPSLRKGSTGIGYTLETMLRITENNAAASDIEGAELKTHRHNSNICFPVL